MSLGFLAFVFRRLYFLGFSFLSFGFLSLGFLSLSFLSFSLLSLSFLSFSLLSLSLLILYLLGIGLLAASSLAVFGGGFTGFDLLLDFGPERVGFRLGHFAVFVGVDAIKQTCQKFGVFGQFVFRDNAVVVGVELEDGEITAFVLSCRFFRSCRGGIVSNAHQGHRQNSQSDQKQFFHQKVSLKNVGK